MSKKHSTLQKRREEIKTYVANCSNNPEDQITIPNPCIINQLDFLPISIDDAYAFQQTSIYRRHQLYRKREKQLAETVNNNRTSQSNQNGQYSHSKQSNRGAARSSSRETVIGPVKSTKLIYSRACALRISEILDEAIVEGKGNSTPWRGTSRYNPYTEKTAFKKMPSGCNQSNGSSECLRPTTYCHHRLYENSTTRETEHPPCSSRLSNASSISKQPNLCSRAYFVSLLKNHIESQSQRIQSRCYSSASHHKTEQPVPSSHDRLDKVNERLVETKPDTSASKQDKLNGNSSDFPIAQSKSNRKLGQSVVLKNDSTKSVDAQLNSQPKPHSDRSSKSTTNDVSQKPSKIKSQLTSSTISLPTSLTESECRQSLGSKPLDNSTSCRASEGGDVSKKPALQRASLDHSTNAISSASLIAEQIVKLMQSEGVYLYKRPHRSTKSSSSKHRKDTASSVSSHEQETNSNNTRSNSRSSRHESDDSSLSSISPSSFSNHHNYSYRSSHSRLSFTSSLEKIHEGKILVLRSHKRRSASLSATNVTSLDTSASASWQSISSMHPTISSNPSVTVIGRKKMRI